MQPDPEPEKDPSFGPNHAQNSPKLPQGELGTFLGLITPSGAPALHLGLWGVRFSLEHFPLPLTFPATPRPDWLRSELDIITFNGVPLKENDVRRLVALLAPGPPRPDGLPAYIPHIWGAAGPQTPTGRRNAMVRRVAAAVACDLGAYDLVEVSAKVLNLADHRKANQETPGDPKKAREFRNLGRGLLARLGVWPWTHAPDGQLSKTWRTDAIFLNPLALWFERAIGEREQELARCRWAWAEGHQLRENDLLKLPKEGTRRWVQPELPHHWFGTGANAEEEGLRALDANIEDEAARTAAFEQARASRRPLQ